MTERPILFSDPMVRAILAGTKTQTRRVVKVQPNSLIVAGAELVDRVWCWLSGHDGSITGKVLGHGRCPYGQPGDRLWVRESFQRFTDDGEIIYKADPKSSEAMNELKRDECLEARWRPSIHMPRRFSRIDLEITAVRVERLQAISRGDAMEEGCPFPNMASGPDPREWYSGLWNEINGAGSWNANPWVWCLTFKRV